MVSVRRVAPVLLLVLAIPALAAAPKKSSSRPPHELHRVGDHWTAYNPPDPSTYPPNAKSYTIKAGDTLWGLAQQFYKNAYLWPQLWEGNTWITDAHWIYPGDVVLVEGEAAQAAEETKQSSTLGGTGTPQQTGAAQTLTTSVPATGSTPIALATEADLYCYGYIGDPSEPMPNHIDSFEDVEMTYHPHVLAQTDSVSTGDLVYVAGGTSTGLNAGDIYLLVLPGDLVSAPNSKRSLGREYHYIGQLKILCADATRSRAVITQSCREIENGARLKPLPQLAIPIARIPDLPAFCDSASGRASGLIVSSKGWESGLGISDLVQVNLGHDDQIQPGDFLTVFRDSPLHGQGRIVLGELAILTTESHTATARVVAMRRSMEVGDMVEIR
jgi:LysM domain